MDNASFLPKDFLAKLDVLIPYDKKAAVLQSFSERRPTSFRINTLKTSLDEVLPVLNKNSLKISPVKWYPDAFILNDAKTALTSLPEYKSGDLYIQGLSSMIPVLVLGPNSDDKILDLAAAPGSKTTQMATLMNNEGEIVANDISRTRLFKLKANLKEQGVTNVTITNLLGERIWRKYPEYFDKVLVDAPCSMEGRFHRDDPDSYKDWSIKKVKELSRKQQYLLRSALTATKVGGTLVYSTCTLSPEENEGVIDWLLEKEGEAIEIVQVQISGLILDPGITQWKNKIYDPKVRKTARVYPNEHMEGFFIAKIRKNRTTLRPELFK